MDNNLIVGILILIGIIIFSSCLCRSRVNESYRRNGDFNDYELMSQLPWVTPPTGIGALGEIEADIIRKIYPRQRFYTGKVPVSCPPSGVRIYETGNALNPNVQSYII